LSGQRFKRIDDSFSLRGGKLAHPPEEQANQGQDHDLRGERLRCRNPDLGASVHVNAAVAFARDRARNVVANSERAIAFAFAFAQCAEGVGGLSALTDRENQGVLGRRRVSMAIFTGKIDIHRNVGQLLNGVFANSGRVQRGATAS